MIVQRRVDGVKCDVHAGAGREARGAVVVVQYGTIIGVVLVELARERLFVDRACVERQRRDTAAAPARDA